MEKNAWQYALNFIKYTDGVEGKKASEELKLFLKRWILVYQPLNILIKAKVDQNDNSITFSVTDTNKYWEQKVTIFNDNKIQIHSVQHSSFGQTTIKLLESLNNTLLVISEKIKKQEEVRNSLSKKTIIDTDFYQPISKRTRFNSYK